MSASPANRPRGPNQRQPLIVARNVLPRRGDFDRTSRIDAASILLEILDVTEKRELEAPERRGRERSPCTVVAGTDRSTAQRRAAVLLLPEVAALGPEPQILTRVEGEARCSVDVIAGSVLINRPTCARRDDGVARGGKALRLEKAAHRSKAIGRAGGQ